MSDQIELVAKVTQKRPKQIINKNNISMTRAGAAWIVPGSSTKWLFNKWNEKAQKNGMELVESAIACTWRRPIETIKKG